MNVRWLTALLTLLTLALDIPGCSRIPDRVNAEPSKSAPHFRLGDSIALSDFDADGFLDEARIEGSNWRKSVGILLSGTGKRSFLHFSADHPIHGSLLAQDIDNDGATDLIWSNPFRANDAVVWLGDGAGRFVQVDSSDYSLRLALGNTGVAEPEGSNQETAITFENNLLLDQAVSAKYLNYSASPLTNDYLSGLAVSSPALDRPTGRAPPFLLS